MDTASEVIDYVTNLISQDVQFIAQSKAAAHELKMAPRETIPVPGHLTTWYSPGRGCNIQDALGRQVGG